MKKRGSAGMTAGLLGLGIVVAGMILSAGSSTMALAQVTTHNRGDNDTSTWKTYRSEKHGFELKYPATWSIHEGSGSTEGVLICRTPQPDATTGVQFTLQPQANPKRLSIEDWVDNELRKIKAPSLQKVPMTIGRKPAVRIQIRDTVEIVVRLNDSDILNIFYPSSQPADPTYGAILSTLKFL